MSDIEKLAGIFENSVSNYFAKAKHLKLFAGTLKREGEKELDRNRGEKLILISKEILRLGDALEKI